MDRLKIEAGEYAVRFVESGMAVGLGTGSTAIHAVRRIGRLMQEGVLRDIVGFATSSATLREAEALGIPLLGEDLPCALDVTIDGADEVDPAFNVIKGGGGALLREKIVA
ncbi:MAG: ribose-5-phosphate isomerase A, partial [Caldilineaceae bacterium]|nr:ribose-5-phosphate isomerase A [Caldilineaceae bacterium]